VYGVAIVKIIRTKTEVFDVINVKKDFCVFNEEFIKIRKKFHHDKSLCCFRCQKPFEIGDTVGLMITNKGNVICCDRCSDEFLSEVK
jgi:hypothetical protein